MCACVQASMQPVPTEKTGATEEDAGAGPSPGARGRVCLGRYGRAFHQLCARLGTECLRVVTKCLVSGLS